MVQKHIELNERVRTIPGYRIQIASLSGTESKNRAFDMKERIREAYPGVEAYVVFDEPNFKVKVGDFRTRLDAFVFLQHIRNEFPGTIIRDNIYPTQINWDEMIPETHAHGYQKLATYSLIAGFMVLTLIITFIE